MRIFALVVLLLASQITSAQDVEQFGDWKVQNYATSANASVKGSSNSNLGIVCSKSTEGCNWIFSVWSVSCRKDSAVPALISNLTIGAESVTLKCLENSSGSPADLSMFYIEPYRTFNKVIIDGQNVNIAVAMSNGEIHVFTFSLSGAQSALDRIIALVTPFSGNRSNSER